MADVIKMKPKKTYEWNQDKKFIFVQIPLPAHTSLKKVDIFLSDVIFRVTSLEKKQTHFLDLAQEIDFNSSENKFILTNGLLHATLKKAIPDSQWTKLLIQDISLADLKERRKQSEARYEKNIKAIEEHKDKIRVQYDRKATQELMRFEQEEREKLENKKKIEKESAIREVFSNVNEKTGKIEAKTAQVKRLQLERTQNKWNEKQKLALKMLEEEQASQKSHVEKALKEKQKNKIIEQVTKQYEKGKGVTKNNTMFTDEQIEKYQQMRNNLDEGVQLEQIPIRKSATQKVNFTQRIHKNLAAREQFYKEPPMPQNKGTNKLTNGDLESKNPLWLKDKGDSFFKDKNYISAIEAYSEALKIDSKLLSSFMNRSICYMKAFKLSQAIGDCDQALLLLQSQISGDQEAQIHSRLTLAKIKTRKAICTAWKGQLQNAKTLLKDVLELELTQQIKNQVNDCVEQIRKRQQSIRSKARGDELVKLNNPEQAIDHYSKAIDIDDNQYALSNKVLCLNKIKHYQKSVEQAQKGIKKLLTFNIGSTSAQTKEDKQASLILLKLYYRKSKALEELGAISEAEQNIRKGLTINAEDKDLQEYLKTLKKRQNKGFIKAQKDEAASYIKQGKVKEALQNYIKCLKLLEQAQDIQEYLAILQNQCVCYQKLQKYDDVLSTCIRILKLVNRVESKILQFGGRKEAPSIEKEDLKKISVRTLVRRANAYIKTDQYYNAKADLQKAYQISPEQSIKKQLQNLKAKLNAVG